MRSSVLPATALVLATTTLAACGGVDKQKYVQSVTNLQQKTSTEAAYQSDEMAKATTPGALSQELSELGTSIDANAKKLAAIETPDEVDTLHADYVDLMEQYGRDLKALAGEVKTSDAKTTNRLLKRASTITAKLATDESKLVTGINSALR
ncbi:MAG: hypothetical protein Q7T55_15065 [Solirubrobacteraceae bacterium]|nr:hypothetical protein [Solirubrobacteraceae bacterium]